MSNISFNQTQDLKASVAFSESDVGQRPIDLLTPGSDKHKTVLKYLLDRLGASERAMKHRYDRWRLNEMQFQAYISLRDHEQILKQTKVAKGMPQITSLVIPYSYSTIMSIVTYLLQTYAGRDPIFQLTATKAESMPAVPMMEAALKHNCNHTKMVLKLFQFLLDGQVYSLSVMRNLWTVEERMTTVFKKQQVFGPLGMMPDFQAPTQRTRERRVVFEGTDTVNVDPFMFFPDPRVAFTELSRKGEFVFWRDFQGKHSLVAQEADGLIAHLDSIGDRPKGAGLGENTVPQSNRNNGTSSTSTQSNWRSTQEGLEDFVQLDQGTVEIVPSKLGLGDSDRPEKWLFTIANKKQIIQAEPLELDHGMHPIVVSEPYSMGYVPGGMSMVEMLEPLQNGMSWLLNSHIHNVRAVLNNSFIVDPSAVDMSTFKDGRPGKLIKLKPSAVGRDVRSVIQQLQIQDVTGSHIADIEQMKRIGDAVSAINDNMRGIQQQGGRKSATEVRTSLESGAGRLVTTARVISAQALVDLGVQMSVNLQQNMSESYIVQTLGMGGLQKMTAISPESIMGDFNFPVHDGTLPLDRVAIVDVWKEIFLAVSQNPILQQTYNPIAIFEFTAELSGATNIEKFKNQPDLAAMQSMAPEQLQQQQAQGNVVPLFAPDQQSLNQGGSALPRFA